MAGKKGMKHYPLATKLEAIGLHEEEGKSYQEIAILLEIGDRKRVEKWMRQYRAEGDRAFGRGLGHKKRGRPPKRENTEAYIARLEMENDLLKNSMPNCASWSSPSAISAPLPPKRTIRSEGDVYFLWGFAGSLLYVGEALRSGGSRCRAHGVGPSSLRAVSPNVWIPENCILASQAQRNMYEPQGSPAVDEQTKHSLGGSQAEDLPPCG